MRTDTEFANIVVSSVSFAGISNLNITTVNNMGIRVV